MIVDCSVEGCTHFTVARGWCPTHYSRRRKYGDPLIVRSPNKPLSNRTCEIEGCDRRHYARGWCSMHWMRWRAHGNPLTKKATGRPAIGTRR